MIPTVLYTGLYADKLGQSSLNSVHFHHLPTIQIEYEHPEDYTSVQEYLSRSSYIVFFSKNGVIGLDRWLKDERLAFPFDRSTIWTVGRATAGMVWEKFKLPVVQPLEQNALGLIKAFKTIAKKPVVMFIARKSRPQFSEWLVEHHWDYLQVVVYTTQIKDNKNLPEHFRNVSDEYIIFTSPSTVKGFLKSLGIPDLGNVASRLISIGPTTTDEIRALNGRVYEELVEPNLADYLEKWCVTND